MQSLDRISRNSSDNPSVRSFAFISVKATSLVDFRGPLISAMVLRKIKVYALAPDFDELTRNILISMGVEPVDICLNRTEINPFKDVLDTLRIAQVLRKLKPDATLGYFIKPVIYGTFASFLAGIPIRYAMIEGLGSAFSDQEHTPSLRKRILRKSVINLYRLSLKLTTKVIFLNPDDINDFVSWGVINKNKTFELGGIGVDLKEWSFKPILNNPIKFIFIGRFIQEKGIELFLEAAKKIKFVHPEVEFIILGDFEDNGRAVDKQLINECIQSGIVTYPGYVPVKNWLEQSSVFVLPSYYREGLPRSIQEAMAIGRAIITTNSPGCKETVLNNINGFLIPIRDVNALVTAMKRFIDDPLLITRMGHESRRLAEHKFDVNIVNERLMRLFNVIN